MSTAVMWFDPICPFTWMTSRWLRSVAAERGVTVELRVMSLAILNGDDVPEPYASWQRWSRDAQRVLVSLEQEELDRLYGSLGALLFDKEAPKERATLETALADAGLPAAYLDRADDARWDEAVAASHHEGQMRAGQESGSPVVAVGDGPGYFGPIISAVPDTEAAGRLFDALCLLSTVPQFSELKRAR